MTSVKQYYYIFFRWNVYLLIIALLFVWIHTIFQWKKKRILNVSQEWRIRTDAGWIEVSIPDVDSKLLTKKNNKIQDMKICFISISIKW